MIDWLVSFALRKRLMVAMICILAAIYGCYSWTQLAIDAYPDIADTTSQVVTQAPGLAAEEVEQQITIPLERELNGTPGLRDDALAQHLRPVADHRSCSATASRITGRASASWSASRTSPCRRGVVQPRSADLADRGDLPLHAGIDDEAICASSPKSSAGR